MKNTLLTLVPLIALSAWMPGAMAAADKPNILVIFGDDRHDQCQRLHSRDDGPHAEHRPHRQRGHDVHRPLCASKLHRRAGRVPHGQSAPHRADRWASSGGRCAYGRAPTLAEVLKNQGYATGQFGKNHWVTKTSSCPRFTDSTNSSATVPPEREEEPKTSGLPPRIRSSERSVMDPVECCTPGQPTPRMRPSRSPSSARWASNGSSTPVR